MRETTFAERVHQAHPTEIYVPTIVAQNNLSLLKNMSTSSVWANAPASVRSPTPENPQNTYQAPTFGSKTGNSKPPGSLDRTGEDDGSKKKQAEKRKHDSRNNGMLNPGSNPVLTSNVSTATTNLMTNTLGTHQACFHDLENEIRQRNESIKTQQKEFSKVNERLDVLETQTMSTLHFCKESSQNVLELHQETSSQLLTVRQEAATNVLESRSNFAAMTALIQQLSMQLQAANQPAPSHTGSCSSHQSDNEMSIKSTSTTRSMDSVQVMSPEKKKQRTPPSKPRTPPRNRLHNRTPSPSPKSRDRAQYNPPRTSDREPPCFALDQQLNHHLRQYPVHQLSLRKMFQPIMPHTLDHAQAENSALTKISTWIPPMAIKCTIEIHNTSGYSSKTSRASHTAQQAKTTTTILCRVSPPSTPKSRAWRKQTRHGNTPISKWRSPTELNVSSICQKLRTAYRQ